MVTAVRIFVTTLKKNNLSNVTNHAFYDCPGLDEPSRARIRDVCPDAK